MSRWNFVTLCVAMLALSSCDRASGPGAGGDSQQKAARDAGAAAQEISDALADVTDVASAQAAAGKINASVAELEKIATRIRNLPAPSEAEAKILRDELKPRLDQVTLQASAAQRRIKDLPEAQRALQGPLMDVERAVMGLSFAAMAAGSPRPGQPRPGSPGTYPPADAPPPAAQAQGTPPAMSQRPSAPENMARQRLQSLQRQREFLDRHAGHVVTLRITGIPPQADMQRFLKHLQAATGAGQYSSSGAGSSRQIMLAPIDDANALAAKVDFGKVTQVDAANHTVDVQADVEKITHPPAGW
jgi:hypothetical protein